ncbi:unnamed protein product, partial [Mesorhabditis spiculigera]
MFWLFLSFGFYGNVLADDKIVCYHNKSLPPYQPNVYLCGSTSSCCHFRGEPACCLNDVAFWPFLQQVIPFLVFYLLTLLAAKSVQQWYFSDQDPDLEDQLFDFSGQKEQANTFIFPQFGEDHVADPIFGAVYEEKTPKYAMAAQDKIDFGYFDDDGDMQVDDVKKRK